MSINSGSLRQKIKSGLSRAGTTMILRQKITSTYDPITSEASTTTQDTEIIGMVFDLNTADKQQFLTEPYAERKKITFNAVENIVPQLNDEILILNKVFVITKIVKTLPLVGEDLMYQVIVKV